MDPKFKVPAAGSLRLELFRFVNWRWFDIGIMFLIVCNVFALLLETFPPNPELNGILAEISFYFLLVFTVEAAMKVHSWGLKTYLADGWCRLDAVILMISWLSAVPGLLAMRALRILRITLLFKNSKGLSLRARTLWRRASWCSSSTAT